MVAPASPSPPSALDGIRRAARAALPVAAVLVVYGSLYPFKFVSTGAPLLGWPRYPTTSDILVNLLLYVPLGALAVLAWPARGRLGAVLHGVAPAAVLSLAIEVAQAFDTGRHSSRLDVIMNALGALGGVVLVAALRRAPFWRRLPLAPHVGSALLVLGLWLSWRLSPFLLDFTGATLAPTLQAFLARPRPNGPLVFGFFVQWLLVIHLAAALGEARHVLARAALLAATVLALRFWMPGKVVSLQELYGFALAAGAWAIGLRQAWLAALLLAIHFIQAGFAPIGSGPPRPTNWMPFRLHIRSGSEYAMQALLGSLFAAGVFIWLLARTGIGYRGAVPVGLGVSIGIEWGQTGVPGRYPDVTGPVVHCAMALVMARIDAALRPAAPASSPAREPFP